MESNMAPPESDSECRVYSVRQIIHVCARVGALVYRSNLLHARKDTKIFNRFSTIN
jgi:hypothetical protein